MDYRDYQHRTFERWDRGVVLVTIHRPEVLKATTIVSFLKIRPSD